MLLKLGAAIDQVEVSGKSALHIAVIQGHVEIVQLLKASGANLKLRDFSQNTPQS